MMLFTHANPRDVTKIINQFPSQCVEIQAEHMVVHCVNSVLAAK